MSADEKIYRMDLDGGQGGEDEIKADSLAEALKQALEWAADGDWANAQEGTEERYGGCGTVQVRVWREDDEGETIEEASDGYEIPTLGDLQDMEMDYGEVIACNQHEYSTESIVRVEDELYYRHANGGARGAYDRMDGDGVWRDSPVDPSRLLTVQEARVLLLDWGYAPADAGRMTAGVD